MISLQRTITQLNLPDAHFGEVKTHLGVVVEAILETPSASSATIKIPALRFALESFATLLIRHDAVHVTDNHSNRKYKNVIEQYNKAAEPKLDSGRLTRLFDVENSAHHLHHPGFSRPHWESALTTAVEIICTWREGLHEKYGPALIDEHANKVSAYKNRLDAELVTQGHNHYIGRRAKFIAINREDSDEDEGFSLLRRPPDLSKRAYNDSGAPKEIVLHHLDARHNEAVVFVASEGMGKTFEVNQLASTLTDITEKRLCVWLPCRAIYDADNNSLERLWGRQDHKLRPHFEDIYSLPNEWKIILILDGVDEITDDDCIKAFAKILDESKAVVKKRKGIVVVTGRDVDSVHNRFNREFRYALQEFDDKDIRRYLEKKDKEAWFNLLPTVPGNRVASFLRIPFFLAALVETNLDEGKLSGLNRAALLNEYLDVLLARELRKLNSHDAREEVLERQIGDFRRELLQHAVGLTISGKPIKKRLGGMSLEEITLLLNQKEPHAFRHDVVRHFLLALSVKAELDVKNRDLFNQIARRTAGPDEASPLPDAERQTIWSLLLEMANNNQYKYLDTIEALCEADPMLVYFGLKDRSRLPEKYKAPEIIEWNLFQSGLCKCLLDVDPQPERSAICYERLASPEELLIARLRDENLRYVATAEAKNALRTHLIENLEPWGDVVEAMGYEMAFGGQHPLPEYEKLVRYALGLARVGSDGGFVDFNALVTGVETFLQDFESNEHRTLFHLNILCWILRRMHKEYFTDANNTQQVDNSSRMHLRLGEILHDWSDGFIKLTTRQVHRLFADGALKVFISKSDRARVGNLTNRMRNDKVIDYEVFELKTCLPRIKEELEDQILNITNNFRYLNPIPPIKILGIKKHFGREFDVHSSCTQEWMECWSKKLSSWEVCNLVKKGFTFPNAAHGYVPISIEQSYGWLPGRDAVILAHPRSSLHVWANLYSTEQKEYWCRFATNGELRDLLEFGVIVRNDIKIFRQMVSILLERSSPVFLRKLLPGSKTPIIQAEDFPPWVKEKWMGAVEERPDYNIACRRLGWIDRQAPLREELIKLVASDTGYLHERKYFLDNKVVMPEKFWEIERPWAESIECDPRTRNLSLHPFLLAYYGRNDDREYIDSDGEHIFIHPPTGNKIRCSHKILKKVAGNNEIIENRSLFCACLKLARDGWVISDVKSDFVMCDIQIV